MTTDADTKRHLRRIFKPGPSGLSAPELLEIGVYFEALAAELSASRAACVVAMLELISPRRARTAPEAFADMLAKLKAYDDADRASMQRELEEARAQIEALRDELGVERYLAETDPAGLIPGAVKRALEESDRTKDIVIKTLQGDREPLLRRLNRAEARIAALEADRALLADAWERYQRNDLDREEFEVTVAGASREPDQAAARG